MSKVDTAVLPAGGAGQDLVADMRRRLIEQSLKGSSAGLIKSSQASGVAAAAAPAVAPPTIRKAAKSIFDPFGAAPPAAQTPKPAAIAPAVASVAVVAAPVAPPIAAAPVAASVKAPQAAVVPHVDAGSDKAAAPRRYSMATYSAVTLLALLLGVGTVYNANEKFAGEMYGNGPMTAAAEAFSRGKNYATFDLNINIRQLREQQVARMTKTPDVVLLGASHWQEAEETLLKHKDLYNSHIHRDYWEDLFGMIEMWERHDRLPKQMIISLRDNQFMPIEVRRDFLWEPGIPGWRRMADKMGIPKESFWKSYPWQRLRERLSLQMLFTNLTRWYNAEELPHETSRTKFDSLDVLLPGGSIIWSQQHTDFFTQERAKYEAETFADFKIENPPVWEQRGLENFEKLLKYVQSKGVEITFVFPPFNPLYWDRVQNTKYSARLDEYVSIIKGMADRHKIAMIGSFNPYNVGCTKEQYIDAEHANATCLQNIFDEFTALDTGKDTGRFKGKSK
jgi:hypothetical protein